MNVRRNGVAAEGFGEYATGVSVESADDSVRPPETIA